MFGSLVKLFISNGFLTLCLLFLVLITIALYVHLTYYKHSERFMELANKIPGPMTFPFIGSAYIFGTNPRDILKNIIEISVSYGSVSRHWIGPMLNVSLQEHRDIEVILSSNEIVDKTFANDFMKVGIGNGILAASGEKWRKRRKLLNPAFSVQVLEKHVEVFYKKMKIMNDVLEPQVESELNICRFIRNCFFDILCETMMSAKSNTQNESGIQNQYISSLMLCVEITHNRMFKPWQYVDFIFNKTQSGMYFNIINIHNQYLRNFIKQAISRRKEEMRSEKYLISKEKGEQKIELMKSNSFLDYMLEHAAETSLSEQDIIDETCTNIYAGFDSMAAAAAFNIFILSKRFDIQEKLVEEIIEVFGTLEEKPFTYKDLQKLKYLDRVIKDSLRVLSPVPYIARQITKETKLPCGYTLPNGCAVIIFFCRLHRDSTLYPNPHLFDPDNFLSEKAASRPAYSFCPFSSGPRSCIGQRYSMLELKAVTVSLLRRFWITPVDFKLELANKMNLFTMNGVNIGLTKRTAERPEIKNLEHLSKYIVTNIDNYNIHFKPSYV